MTQLSSLTLFTCASTLRRRPCVSLGVFYAALSFVIVWTIHISADHSVITSISISGGDPMRPDQMAFLIPELPRLISTVLFLLTAMLTLIVTAHILPGNLEPDTLSCQLCRPVSRSMLLAGNLLGIAAGTSLIQLLFLTSVWLIISCKIGAFTLPYLAGLLIPVVAFLAAFSLAALLRLLIRKTALSTALVVLYCAFGSDLVRRFVTGDAPAPLRTLVRIAAVFFPPVSELNRLAAGFFTGGELSPIPLLTALVSTAATAAASILLFRRADA